MDRYSRACLNTNIITIKKLEMEAAISSQTLFPNNGDNDGFFMT
jgi:hypothetical protein